MKGEMTSSQSGHISTSRNNSTVDIVTQPKIKTKIVKTYHHDICMTYEGLISKINTGSDDSDPDETTKFMSNMVLNSGSTPGTTRSSSVSRAKYSIGAISTVDSGVVPHDSLLDHYRDTSATRSERSVSPSSVHSTPSRRSHSHSRGEFDPLNRTVLLDSKIRSRSRGRLEQQRGKSPARSHGVKSMINFFEGSQENISSPPATNNTTPKEPLIKQALHPSPISPYRLARNRNSKSQSATPGSPTVALPDNEGASPTTPTSRTRQENNIHLTCVASGYAKYSPYNERKSYQSGEGVQTTPNGNEKCHEASSNHNVNGAETVVECDAMNNEKCVTSPTANGHLADSTVSNTRDTPGSTESREGATNTNSNNHMTHPENTQSQVLSEDHIDISIDTETGKTTPILSNEGQMTPTLNNGDALSSNELSNGHVDEVDRSIVKLPLDEQVIQSAVIDVKVNGIDQGSPSKKNGEYFHKVTDDAQAKLLALCDIAQKDLETPDLTEEVSGQIRAAIGKAQLLVNKKFKQFRGLCDKNLTQGPDEPFPTTSMDLAGFWDLVYLQVDNIEQSFRDIDRLRENGWVKPQLDTEILPKKPTTPRSQKSVDGSKPETKSKSAGKPSGAAKARDEARKRLMAAKKAMKERRNSETEDVIFVNS